MPFNENDLPKWGNVGTEPPDTKKNTGYAPSEKPPADWFNWIFNKTYKALQSLFANSQHKEEKGKANGYAALDANGKVINADGSKVAGTTVATQLANGLMSKEDKKIVDGLGTASSKNTGTTSGTIPIIGSDGKLDTSIMPAIAITDTFVVNSQTAMLGLNAQIGDVCVRTDLSKSYILKADPASTLENWQELLTPPNAVTSVNGKTGAVTITKSDVGLSNVDNIKQETPTGAQEKADNTRKDSNKTFAVEVRSSDPPSPIIGQMWLRSDL